MKSNKAIAAGQALAKMPGRKKYEQEQALADALSARLGRPISRWRVQKWRNNGVPGEMVLHVAAITGIPSARLDPVLYGQDAA